MLILWNTRIYCEWTASWKKKKRKRKENSTQIKQRVFYFLNKMLFTPHQEVNLTARLTAHLNLCSSSVVRNRKCLMLCERLIIRSPHKHSALISCSDYVPALGPARLWDIFSGTQRSRFFTLADCWRVQEKKQKKNLPKSCWKENCVLTANNHRVQMRTTNPINWLQMTTSPH